MFDFGNFCLCFLLGLASYKPTLLASQSSFQLGMKMAPGSAGHGDSAQNQWATVGEMTAAKKKRDGHANGHAENHEMLKPAIEDVTSWSTSSTASDLLF